MEGDVQGGTIERAIFLSANNKCNGKGSGDRHQNASEFEPNVANISRGGEKKKGSVF